VHNSPGLIFDLRFTVFGDMNHCWVVLFSVRASCDEDEPWNERMIHLTVLVVGLHRGLSVGAVLHIAVPTAWSQQEPSSLYSFGCGTSGTSMEGYGRIGKPCQQCLEEILQAADYSNGSANIIDFLSNKKLRAQVLRFSLGGRWRSSV